jgi:hypothetical protein
MPRRVERAAFCILFMVLTHVLALARGEGVLPPPLSTLPAQSIIHLGSVWHSME